MQQLTTIPLLQYDRALLSYVIGAKNHRHQHIIKRLLATDGYLICYWYGAAGSGKTHLLQAYCYEALNQGQSALYFDCKQEHLSRQNIEQLIKFDWICIDNIHLSSKAAQYVLYSLYNACHLQRKTLMLSAKSAANVLHIGLADLKTRLSLAHNFALEVLDYTQKKQVLNQKMRAQHITISEDIYDYLLLNYSRNLTQLVAFLFQINRYAISEHKKIIKLSFVKDYLKERAFITNNP